MGDILSTSVKGWIEEVRNYFWYQNGFNYLKQNISKPQAELQGFVDTYLENHKVYYSNWLGSGKNIEAGVMAILESELSRTQKMQLTAGILLSADLERLKSEMGDPRGRKPVSEKRCTFEYIDRCLTNLIMLYRDLKADGFIDADTKEENFVKIMNGLPVKEEDKVNWIGAKNELKFFADQIARTQTIIIPEGHTQWICAANSFTVKGESITNVQLRTTTALASLRKKTIIREILKKL